MHVIHDGVVKGTGTRGSVKGGDVRPVSVQGASHCRGDSKSIVNIISTAADRVTGSGRQVHENAAGMQCVRH